MALTGARNTFTKLFRPDSVLSFPVADSATIQKGGIVALDGYGYAVVPTAATNLVTVGLSLEHVDNSAGSNGDKSVTVALCIAKVLNSATTDEITQAEVGDNCYLVSDEKVAKTNGGTTRSIAGKVIQVDGSDAPDGGAGVWVYLGIV